MANVPVFCKNCGSLFITRSFIGGDASQVYLEGNKFSPCPNCGGTGEVLDGTYNFIGESIELLSGPKFTKDVLGELVAILHNAQKENLDPDELKKQLEETDSEFSSISSLLPSTKSELYAFIGMLLAAIGLILSSSSTGVNIEVNQVINNIPNQAENEIRNIERKDSTNISKTDSTSSESKNTQERDNAG